MSDAGGDSWRALADRCWHTVTASGLPERLRPGLWDNSGRCGGTGGVLALALDRKVEDDDGIAFADLFVADLAHRATVDAAGARWPNVEYRATRPGLEPRPGWATGNAGLVRELLRHARITAGRDPSYGVQWLDHPQTARAAAGRLAAPETTSSEGRAGERHGRESRPDLQDPVRGRLGGGRAGGPLCGVGRRPA